MDWLAVEVMGELPTDEARHEIVALADAVRADPGAWPAPGCMEGCVMFGARCWIVYVAYIGEIEIVGIGWAG